MRILFFIDNLCSGGKERRLTELLKGLKLSTTIDFEIVVMNESIHYQEILNLNSKIHYLTRKSKKDFSIFSKFYQISKDFRPDIIHCWDTMTAFYSIPVCILLKIKLINGMVTDAPKWNGYNKTKFRSKLIFPFSDVIIGNSRAGILAYNAPASKSLVIYNGFNFARLAKIMDKITLRNNLNISTQYIIGMVASFSEFKDYETYYKAVSLILKDRNDVTFLSIGNNTDSIASKELANSFSLPPDKVRLLGEISDIESYINILDLGVLATFTEGISNAIMEYMALSKPVIATQGGGTVELVENNKTGFLITVSDPAQMAAYINKLLDDPALRNQMGTSARKKIQECFSIDLMVDNYISVYKSILNNNTPGNNFTSINTNINI